MQCYIYRSSVKEGLYVYVAHEDALKSLPAVVLKQLGAPELAMTLELNADKKLGQEHAPTVMTNIENQGFHVQMPKDIEQQLSAISNNATSGGKPRR